MRLLGQILLACLLIAVLQGMLAVLAVAVVLALICGLLFRPSETAGLIVLLLFLRAVGALAGANARYRRMSSGCLPDCLTDTARPRAKRLVLTQQNDTATDGRNRERCRKATTVKSPEADLTAGLVSVF